MKSIYVLTSIILLLSLTGCSPVITASASNPAAPVPQIAAEPATPRTIAVTGTAVVMVVPDEVILTLGIETSDMQLATAKSENDDIVAKTLKVAKDAGIDPKYVQTDYLSIEPRYQDSYNQSTFLGYWVRKDIVVTLKDITKFEDLLSKCLEAGVNYVHGVEFRTTELRKHRDEARSLAIKAAQEKAIAMAKDLGQEISQPLTIREDYNRWYSPYNSWWGMRYGGGMAQNTIQNAPSAGVQSSDSELAPGQIAVDASVTVEFELKPQPLLQP